MPTIDNIPKRQLGTNGPLVPAIGFGLMSLAGIYGSADDNEERLKVLDHAYKIGARFWDTSDSYGDNFQLLNEWFKRTGKRDEIFLASKFGFILEQGIFNNVDSSAERCKKVCNETLAAIGTDRIDLYYAHRVSPDTPIEETVRAMVELKNEGKIRYMGLCGLSSSTLKRACAIHHIAAIQMEYSPFVRDVENSSSTNLLQTCRELGVSLVCYSPLGRGLVTGAYKSREAVAADARAAHLPWWSEENIEHNAKVVSGFEKLAEKKGCTPSQLALAWLLAQGSDLVPIPGTKTLSRIDENWAAMDVILTKEEEKEVRDFLEASELKGYRSVAAAKKYEYLDTKEEERA